MVRLDRGLESAERVRMQARHRADAGSEIRVDRTQKQQLVEALQQDLADIGLRRS